MKYERIPYMAPGAAYEFVGTAARPLNVPAFDYPISPRENFRRARERNNPLWVPTTVGDFNFIRSGELTGLSEMHSNYAERTDWVDSFGCVWEFVPSAGGSMLKPGHPPLLDDITKWEKKIVWPDLSAERIEACCEKYMSQPYYHLGKMNGFLIGQGCTERLVSVLGGYEEAMLALAEEPDACREFMEEVSRYHCLMFDMITRNLPADMIMYQDDWGTERDTFFSERMMDEIVYGPSEVFLSHVKKSGAAIIFHTDGCIRRFVPHMISLGVDFMQLQIRANDIKAYKEEYGDKIGFDVYMLHFPGDATKIVPKCVGDVGMGGGLFSSVFGGLEEPLWNGLQELYCYSREFYAA